MSVVEACPCYGIYQREQASSYNVLHHAVGVVPHGSLLWWVPLRRMAETLPKVSPAPTLQREQSTNPLETLQQSPQEQHSALLHSWLRLKLRSWHHRAASTDDADDCSSSVTSLSVNYHGESHEDSVESSSRVLSASPSVSAVFSTDWVHGDRPLLPTSQSNASRALEAHEKSISWVSQVSPKVKRVHSSPRLLAPPALEEVPSVMLPRRMKSTPAGHSPGAMPAPPGSPAAFRSLPLPASSDPPLPIIDLAPSLKTAGTAEACTAAAATSGAAEHACATAGAAAGSDVPGAPATAAESLPTRACRLSDLDSKGSTSDSAGGRSTDADAQSAQSSVDAIVARVMHAATAISPPRPLPADDTASEGTPHKPAHGPPAASTPSRWTAIWKYAGLRQASEAQPRGHRGYRRPMSAIVEWMTRRARSEPSVLERCVRSLLTPPLLCLPYLLRVGCARLRDAHAPRCPVRKRCASGAVAHVVRGCPLLFLRRPPPPPPPPPSLAPPSLLPSPHLLSSTPRCRRAIYLCR